MKKLQEEWLNFHTFEQLEIDDDDEEEIREFWEQLEEEEIILRGSEET